MTAVAGLPTEELQERLLMRKAVSMPSLQVYSHALFTSQHIGECVRVTVLICLLIGEWLSERQVGWHALTT